MKKFSVFESIKFGLKAVIDNFGLFLLTHLTMFFCILGAVVTMVLFNISLYYFTGAVIKKEITQQLQFVGKTVPEVTKKIVSIYELPFRKMLSYWELGGLISFLVSMLIIGLLLLVLVLGYTKLVLEVHDRGTSSVGQLFSCFHLLPKFLVALMIYVTVVAIGFLLFVIPGIILAIRLGFFRYFIVDKNTGIIESLQRSYAITAGHFWNLIGLIVALLVLQGLGALIIIGTLITWPARELAYAYVYRKLSSAQY